MQNYDVIVCGAGVVGVSTALHLQRFGKRVALVDRREPGRETSYGNAGIIENSYVLPYPFPALKSLPNILMGRDPSARADLLFLPQILPWILNYYFQSSPANRELNGRLMRPLVADAIEFHQELMRGTDAEKYLSKMGRIKIHRSKKSFDSGAFERSVLEKLNVPFKVFDATALRDIEPFINPFFYRALMLTNSARVTDPGAVVESYAQRFIQQGGSFIHGDAKSLRQIKQGMWQVGAIEAPQVVIALGPWSSTLIRTLGYKFPIIVKRGYHQHYKISVPINHAIIDADFGYGIRMCSKGARITTGAEFAALDAPPNPIQLDQGLPYARQLFPLEEAIDEAPWLGSRPCTTDGLPIVGKAPKHDGLWLNIGHGHSGFTIGPSTGKLLAQMMVGTQTFTDPAPYKPERF